MIDVEIKGVDELIMKSRKWRTNIRKRLVEELRYVGDRLIEKIKIEFPGTTVSSIFFEDKLEFHVLIKGIIVCSVTGARINTEVEKQVGRYNEARSVAFGKDTEKALNSIIEKIFLEAVPRIENAINQELKR